MQRSNFLASRKGRFFASHINPGFLLSSTQEHLDRNDEISRLLELVQQTRNVAQARLLHDTIRQSQVNNMYLANHVLIMYGRCNALHELQATFEGMSRKNIVSWNVLISAYAQNGHHTKAMRAFMKMTLEGMKPSYVTFTSVLNALVSPQVLSFSRTVHVMVTESGMEMNPVVATALLNMYSKNGSLEQAKDIFDMLKERDVVTWSNMIAAYAQCGHGALALETFQLMSLEGIHPNVVTFVAVVNACVLVARIADGRRVHSQVVEAGLESNTVLGTALVNMFGKCGGLVEARTIFDKLGEKDVVVWSAILEAYAQHGHPRLALKIFKLMQQEGVRPNDVTFVGVLEACSHGGFVPAGRFYFSSLIQDHEIVPTSHHLHCMLDLLGRAGELEEAECFISQFPIREEAITWTTFLGACRSYGDVERGKVAAEKVFELLPQCRAGYLTLASLYTDAGMLDEAEAVVRRMEERCPRKEPGSSSIVVKGKVHEFCVRSQWHPQAREIYSELDRLHERIEKLGYVADTRPLMAGSVERRLHSERLALAFGTMNTPGESTLYIIKNLRVCRDCHEFTRLVSRIIRREVVVRDASRFHSFRDGVCSCGDYW